MIDRRAIVVSALLIAAMFVAAYWVASQPIQGAHIPVQFGPDGQPVAWAPVDRFLFGAPKTALIVWALTSLALWIEPRRQHVIKSRRSFGSVAVGATCLFAIMQACVIADALGATIDLRRATSAFLGAAFIVAGNGLGKRASTYLEGIVAPWALKDERIWDRAGRFAGWVYVIGGLTIIAEAFALPLLGGGVMLPRMTTLAVAFIVFMIPVVKSYILWRDSQRQSL